MELTIEAGADAGRRVAVDGTDFTIGREASCDLVLNDEKVSRRHAALRLMPDGRATLYDLGSTHGTFVDGRRVHATIVHGNERVQVGDTVLVPQPGLNGDVRG